MTKDEALKLALEALTHLQPNALTSFYTIGNRDKAIKAIREALAQPEQEITDSEMFKIRSAYRKGFEHGMKQSPQRKDSSADALIRQYVNALVANKPDEAANATKQMVDYVYTTPPHRKPLSNQKIIEMYNEPRSDAEMIEFARAIEAAHGIWPENSDCYGPDWTDRDGEYLK